MLGVYVLNTGHRSRKQELMWSSPPNKVAYTQPYLLSYCQHCVDVYDVRLVAEEEGCHLFYMFFTFAIYTS